MALDAMKLFQYMGNKEGLADAHQQLGNILIGKGQHADALKVFEAGQTIMLQIIKHDPDNADWLHQISIFHINKGHSYQDQGKMMEALREYEACQSILLQLNQQNPENARWQHDLSASHYNIGRIYQAQGKMAVALQSI